MVRTQTHANTKTDAESAETYEVESNVCIFVFRQLRVDAWKQRHVWTANCQQRSKLDTVSRPNSQHKEKHTNTDFTAVRRVKPRTDTHKHTQRHTQRHTPT